MLYLIVLILLFIGVYIFDVKNRNKNRNVYFYYLLFVFISISGLSYRMGTDVISYMKEYEHYGTFKQIFNYDYYLSFNDRMPGWVFLVTFLKGIGFSFYGFKFFHAFVINSIIFLTIKRYSKFLYSTLLLYYVISYFYFNFEILRETLAISCFLLSVPFLLKSQYFKYYGFIFLAFLFHISASFLLFLPLVRILPLNNKKYFPVIILIPIIIFLFSSFFIETIFKIIEIEFFAEKAMGYFNSERYSISILSFSMVINILFNVVFPYYIIYTFLKSNNKDYLIISPFVFIYTFLYCLTLLIPIFYRLNNYFILFFFIYLAGITFERKNRVLLFKKEIMYKFLFYTYLLMKILVYRNPIEGTPYPSYYRYYPYTSIFTKEKLPQREAIYNY